MNYFAQLLRIETIAIAALFIVAAVLAAVFAVQSSFTEGAILGFADTSKIVFLTTMMWGLGPVIVFGAPLYTFLRQHGHASLASAIGLGSIPGILFLLLDVELGVWAVACGIAVAGITHFISKAGSNRVTGGL
jgi:hypothetical protein